MLKNLLKYSIIFTVHIIIPKTERKYNMRMRKKKHGAERIAACSSLIIQDMSEIVNIVPVELEIGCGKGSFICQLAKRNPDITYIAMEKISDVILLAMERIKNEGINNVKFINGDAKIIPELFPAGSVRRIYLNFSDPWSKKGYAKRRLTHRNFLDIYKSVLVPDGEIIFKTDNVGLFDFSLEEFEASGFTLTDITRDLHNSEYNADNIETEYERNFSEKGFAINRVVAHLGVN